jgi:non-specific serine/threonine protein kinase
MPLDEVIEQALAVLREPQAQPTAATRNARSGLSERELQVVELIAQGLTNRQIADRLVIAERTTHAHVRNILDKLDCSSRVEIATWAVQNLDLT